MTGAANSGDVVTLGFWLASVLGGFFVGSVLDALHVVGEEAGGGVRWEVGLGGDDMRLGGVLGEWLLGEVGGILVGGGRILG